MFDWRLFFIPQTRQITNIAVYIDRKLCEQSKKKSWTKACLVSKRYNHLLYTGRFGVNRLPRQERLCANCNLQDVEDVYHFVWICPKYRTIRLKYINRYYCVRPSVYKFYDLLSSNDKKYLYNLACYAKVAFRNNFDFITIH